MMRSGPQAWHGRNLENQDSGHSNGDSSNESDKKKGKSWRFKSRANGKCYRCGLDIL